MVRLPKLSSILRRDVYVKMESLNPGGTGKDRAALGMIRAAEASGALPPPFMPSNGRANNTPPTPPNDQKQNGTTISSDPLDGVIREAMKESRTGGLVVEGTSGSTGIALAMLCTSRGHACLVVLPDDQAVEKQKILKTLGAIVYVVPNVAISNPKHYVNIARRLAERAQNVWGVPAVFTDQFENAANFQVHFEQTGPEIARQCPDLDAFVMSSGTGGTIAGVGRYLKKELVKNCKIVLVDPPGSALFNKIEHGVAYASQQREREIKRHRYDTLAEGIGLDRVTHNFSLGLDCIDAAVRVTDQEAVDMAHWLLHTEGLWVGSSTAMNIVGAVRTALELKEGSKVVTIVCDNGNRHLTRFWNQSFCVEWGLLWPGDASGGERVPDCLRGVDRVI
jgi:cysteine synthase A